MSAVTRKSRPIVDDEDFEHCKTKVTGAGLITSGFVFGASIFSGNVPIAWMSAMSFAGSWFGHDCARESVINNGIRSNTQSLICVIDDQRSQIIAKDKLIQDQKTEIEKLQKVNIELEEKVQQLEEAQKSFDELNEEHLQILEQQKKQIEEDRGFLSKLTGLIQGYEQRKAKLQEEIQQAREEREKLQSDIKSFLAEQRRINKELAERIAELGGVADRMNGAVKV